MQLDVQENEEWIFLEAVDLVTTEIFERVCYWQRIEYVTSRETRVRRDKKKK